jgi:hypothetical protein
VEGLFLIRSLRGFWNWYLDHLTGVIAILTPTEMAIGLFSAFFPDTYSSYRTIKWVLITLAFLLVMTAFIKGVRFLFAPDFGTISTVRKAIVRAMKTSCKRLYTVTGVRWECLLYRPRGHFPRSLSVKYATWNDGHDTTRHIKNSKYRAFELPPGLAWASNSIQLGYLKNNDHCNRWLITKKIKDKVPNITNMISGKTIYV